MKSPIETIKGKITEVDERSGYVTIKIPYDDWFTFTKRDYQEAVVQLIDSRELSYKQRNMCYALLREISEWSGESEELTKMYFKLRFMVNELHSTADEIFSLSNAPKSLICAFQRFLIRFMVENEVPCKKPLLEYVDDQGDFIYSSLINKKCCICGRHSDLHHVDSVGAGRDRTHIIHEGMEVLPLCREHHTEFHKIGKIEFMDKYHLDRGVKLDKDLCKIYGLKYNKELSGYEVTEDVEYEEEFELNESDSDETEDSGDGISIIQELPTENSMGRFFIGKTAVNYYYS